MVHVFHRSAWTLPVPLAAVPWRRGLAACLLSVLALLASPVRAEEETLRVRLAGGAELTYPTYRLGTGRYVSIAHTSDLMRAIDSGASIAWDASTGVYRATVQGNEFSLYRDQSVLLFNNSAIETPERLAAARGQFFVPLRSLLMVLGRLQGIEMSVPSETAPPPPVATPREPEAIPGEEVEEGSAGKAAAPTEVFRLLSGRDDTPVPNLERDLYRAALPLLARRAYVLDPQTPPIPPGGTGASGEAVRMPAPDVALAIALRCREILSANPGFEVVLTRNRAEEVPTPADRSRLIHAANAKAMVSLLVDFSPFSSNRGYRLYTVHEAVDPTGRRYHGRSDLPGALPQSALYVPYQNLSLVLARLVDYELTRSGLPAAPDRQRLAPLRLLKRAALPSALLSLGCWSNEDDRARLGDPAYVEAAARALAQALLDFDRWLEEARLREMP